jgi:hypothetical protein
MSAPTQQSNKIRKPQVATPPRGVQVISHTGTPVLSGEVAKLIALLIQNGKLVLAGANGTLIKFQDFLNNVLKKNGALRKELNAKRPGNTEALISFVLPKILSDKAINALNQLNEATRKEVAKAATMLNVDLNALIKPEELGKLLAQYRTNMPKTEGKPQKSKGSPLDNLPTVTDYNDPEIQNAHIAVKWASRMAPFELAEELGLINAAELGSDPWLKGELA